MPLRKLLASPIRTRRHTAALIAFLVAPILPAVVGALTSPGLVSPSEPLGVIVFSFIFYIFAAGFISIIALPLYLLASKFDLIRVWTAVLAGALGGGAVAVVVPAGMSQPYYGAAVLKGLALDAPLGAATGVLFYVTLVLANRLLRVN